MAERNDGGGEDTGEAMIIDDQGRRNKTHSPKGICPALRRETHGNTPKAIIIKRHRKDEIRDHGEISPTLTESRYHIGGANPPMVVMRKGNTHPSGKGQTGDIIDPGGIFPSLAAGGKTERRHAGYTNPVIHDKDNRRIMKVGNIFPSGHEEGDVLDPEGISETLRPMGPRGSCKVQAPKIIVGDPAGEKTGILKIRAGNHQQDNLYDPKGIMPAIVPGTHGSGSHLTKIVQPVLTPDREEKRQNGRRFKEDGEPMFTLTGQDQHGVAIKGREGGGDGAEIIEDFYGTVRKNRKTRHSPALRSGRTGLKVAMKGEAGEKDGDGAHNAITGATGNRAGSSKEYKRSVESISRSIGQIRRLTPVECERLQGFPDNWTRTGREKDGGDEEISDTQRYKMMGNAVTVNVIEDIVESWMEEIGG